MLLFAASAAASGSASFRMEPSPVYTSLRNNIPIVRFAQDIRPGSDAVSYVIINFNRNKLFKKILLA